MVVKVLQEDLSKAILLCARFASSRMQLPVLANILIRASKNKLKLEATNLETSVSVTLGAKVEKEGDITVPSKVIGDIVPNLNPGQISLKAEKEVLGIKAENFESEITGINSSDFPAVPGGVFADGMKLSAGEFQESLGKILFSVSGDETRPVLTGVLTIFRQDELLLVSTDGFRLSQEKVKISSKFEDEKRVVIPKGILSEVARISAGSDIEFGYKKSDSQVVFSSDNVTMSSRVIEGDFPDFEKIIPKESKIKVNMDREDFLRSIKLASTFARDSANVVKLNLSSDRVLVSAESQQYGSQRGGFDAKIKGIEGKDDFTIAFNYRFLEEFLGVCESKEIIAEFSEPSSPALFLDPEDKSFFHIIMPVKLQE